MWRCGGLGRVVRNNAAGGQRASRVSFSAWQAVKKNVGLSWSRGENECSLFISRVFNNKRCGSRSEG
jgi:hypothetical protein